MYVVRLMKRCNSRCEFCFVEDEMAVARKEPDIPLDSIKQQILAHPPGSIIDFFGGEPTLYPHILEAIEFANSHGYRAMLATNARRFSNEKFTQALAETGVELVRSTLLGHTAELHNLLSVGGPRSYSETYAGFYNLLKYGIPLQVNMVILQHNYRYLAEMTETLMKLGVRDVKFGSLVGADRYPHLAARIADVRPYLATAIALAERYSAWFAIEKSPICMLPEYSDHYLPESDPLAYKQLDVTSGACRECLVRDRCFGLDEGYATLFGHSELQTVTDQASAQRQWPPARRVAKPGF